MGAFVDEDRKVQDASGGEQIVLRPAGRWARTFVQSIFVIAAGVLLYWSAPALIAFFERGEIVGAARHLERFHLSSSGTFAAMLAWCGLLAWFGVGGLHEILKLHRQQDRFVLRSDSLVVQRRKIRTHEIALPSYEPMALRLRSLDGALEAKNKSGSHVLTQGGTPEDRLWLLELLQQRYGVPVDLPAVTEVTQERVATYIVEKRPDGVTRITSSGLSTVILAVMTAGFIALTAWLFSRGSGAGAVTLMFALGFGLAGLGSFNKRTVEAARGHLRVQWSNSAAPLLRRLPIISFLLESQLGEGSYQANSGSLEIREAGQSSYRVVLVRSSSDDDGEEPDLDVVREDTVLDIHGEGSNYIADHLLRVLGESTGFPTKRSARAVAPVAGIAAACERRVSTPQEKERGSTRFRLNRKPSRSLDVSGIALSPLALAISAWLAYDAWTRIGPDTYDLATFEFVFAGAIFIFAIRAAIDTYSYKPPRFVPQRDTSPGEKRRESILIFAVGAGVALVAAHAIAQNPRDVITILGGGGVLLIGILVMVAAWHARRKIPQETVLRILWWALAGFSLFLAAGYWNLLAFVLLFPIGMFFTVLAVRASIRFGRFGITDLVWEHEPPLIGTTIRGQLRVSRSVTSGGDAPFVVRLSCFSSSPGGEVHDLNLLWSSELEVPVSKVEIAPRDQVAVPIEFTLPEGLLPSGMFRDRTLGTAHSWQLEASRNMKGIDYAVTFPLRVEGKTPDWLD